MNSTAAAATSSASNSEIARPAGGSFRARKARSAPLALSQSARAASAQETAVAWYCSDSLAYGTGDLAATLDRARISAVCSRSIRCSSSATRSARGEGGFALDDFCRQRGLDGTVACPRTSGSRARRHVAEARGERVALREPRRRAARAPPAPRWDWFPPGVRCSRAGFRGCAGGGCRRWPRSSPPRYWRRRRRS